MPPRWIGAALILVGAFGLVAIISPKVARIAAGIVAAGAALVIALATIAALVVAERADVQMDKLDSEEVERRADAMVKKLRDELEREEKSAAAVIGDDQ